MKELKVLKLNDFIGMVIGRGGTTLFCLFLPFRNTDVANN